MIHAVAAQTWITAFRWLAMALEEQNQIIINIGLSRTGIKYQKFFYLKLKRETFSESLLDTSPQAFKHTMESQKSLSP